MTTNVKQNDLPVGDYYRQGNAVAVRDTYRLGSF